MLQRFICIFVTSILISTGFGQGAKEDLRSPPQITIHSDIDTIKSIVLREMATDKSTTLLRESPSQLLFKRVPDGGKAFLGQVMNGGNTPYNLVTFTLTSRQDDVQVSLDTNIAVTDQNGVERITGTANTNKKYREQVLQTLASWKNTAEAMPRNVSPKPVEVSVPSKNPLPQTTANTLVFSSSRDGNQEVYLLDLTTRRQVNLTQSSASDDSYPRFSPDGQKIAFSTNRNGKWQTFLMNRDGSNQRLLTDGGYADWSPDGQSLVFGLSQNGHDEIFSINANGTGRPKQLTFMGKETVHPAWSPDGKKIAFASEKERNRQIYVMNTDGSNLVRLMTNNWYDDYPAWSPDSKQIAFASERDSHNSSKLEIYVINADGTSIRRLTNHPADDRHPAWYPDGKRIVFASDRDGSRDIFSIRVDGTGDVAKLVSAFGNDEHPFWLKTSRSPNPPEPQVVDKRVPAVIHRTLAQQLVRDNKISKECASETNDPIDLVSVEVEDLNDDNLPEYFVMGVVWCTASSSRQNAWYYRKTSIGYEMLLFIAQFENTELLPTKTNGYHDLAITEKSGFDHFERTIYRFNGRQYQANRASSPAVPITVDRTFKVDTTAAGDGHSVCKVEFRNQNGGSTVLLNELSIRDDKSVSTFTSSNLNGSKTSVFGKVKVGQKWINTFDGGHRANTEGDMLIEQMWGTLHPQSCINPNNPTQQQKAKALAGKLEAYINAERAKNSTQQTASLQQNQAQGASPVPGSVNNQPPSSTPANTTPQRNHSDPQPVNPVVKVVDQIAIKQALDLFSWASRRGSATDIFDDQDLIVGSSEIKVRRGVLFGDKQNCMEISQYSDREGYLMNQFEEAFYTLMIKKGWATAAKHSTRKGQVCGLTASPQLKNYASGKGWEQSGNDLVARVKFGYNLTKVVSIKRQTGLGSNNGYIVVIKINPWIEPDFQPLMSLLSFRDELHFYFEKVNGGFRFSGIMGD